MRGHGEGQHRIKLAAAAQTMRNLFEASSSLLFTCFVTMHTRGITGKCMTTQRSLGKQPRSSGHTHLAIVRTRGRLQHLYLHGKQTACAIACYWLETPKGGHCILEPCDWLLIPWACSEELQWDWFAPEADRQIAAQHQPWPPRLQSSHHMTSQAQAPLSPWLQALHTMQWVSGSPRAL